MYDFLIIVSKVLDVAIIAPEIYSRQWICSRLNGAVTAAQ
jgi:hypothetical protein